MGGGGEESLAKKALYETDRLKAIFSDSDKNEDTVKRSTKMVSIQKLCNLEKNLKLTSYLMTFWIYGMYISHTCVCMSKKSQADQCKYSYK